MPILPTMRGSVIPCFPPVILQVRKRTGALCRITEAGIPAGLSFTAGTYVCNDLFYHLMKTAAVPAGFIHVPQAAEEAPEGRAAMAQADINRGILEAVTVLAEMLIG